MDFLDYQNKAYRTRDKKLDREESIKKSLVSLAGEVGELSNTLKKHLWHGHWLDINEVEGELGDILWYLTDITTSLSLDLEDVAVQNIKKLRERYPNGFSEKDSIERTV